MSDPFRINFEELSDYKNVQQKLQICMYDPGHPGMMGARVTRQQGDFGMYYAVRLGSSEDQVFRLVITGELLSSWKISPDQLHEDALQADKARTPTFLSGENMFQSLFFDQDMKNLLETGKHLSGELEPMYCLTNKDKEYGASLILDQGLLDQIGDLLGCDYYVLPSSVHEVMIVPKTGVIELDDIKGLVHEVNITTVPEEIRLTEHVQIYDRKERKLENAMMHEREMQEKMNAVEEERVAVYEEEPKKDPIKETDSLENQREKVKKKEKKR